MWFSLNQLPPTMPNSSITDLKKKTSLKRKYSPQLMPPVAKKKNVDTNTEIENTSVDFNTLTGC